MHPFFFIFALHVVFIDAFIAILCRRNNKKCLGLHVKCQIFLSHFIQIFYLSRYIFMEDSNTKYH
jgi:hypothetical protein